MMVELPGPQVWRWRAPVGHWMVAYGYDDRRVYLSNYGPDGMLWDEFRRAWGGLVPRLISMRNTGLVARHVLKAQGRTALGLPYYLSPMPRVLEVTDVRKHFGPVEALPASRWPWTRARCSACSVPTAPARRPSCRILSGLLDPTPGQVRLFGRPLAPATATCAG